MTKKDRHRSNRDRHKSPVISVRVKPYKMAKLLDGIRSKIPSFEPETMGKTVIAAIDIAINQTTYNLPMEPSFESQRIVSSWIGQRAKRKQAMKEYEEKIITGPIEQMTREQMTKEEILAEGKRLEAEMIAKAQGDRAQTTGKQSGNPLYNDVDLGSEKSIVTDFRPMSAEELSEDE